MNLFLDERSKTNLIMDELYNKIEIMFHTSIFNLKIAYQQIVLLLSLIKNFSINIANMKFIIDVVVLKIIDIENNVLMVLGISSLRHAKVKQELAPSKDFIELE